MGDALRALAMGSVLVAAAGVVGLALLLDRLWRRPTTWPHDLDTLRAAPDWVWDRLVAAGAATEDDRCLRVHVAPFREGEAFRSSLARVTVAVDGPGGPRVLRSVAKFAPREGGLWARVVYVLQGNATKEVGFHTELAPRLGLGGPEVYAAEVRPLTGDMVLLVEQLDATEVSELDGAGRERAEQALTALARLHAATWEGPRTWPPPVPPAFIDAMVHLLPGRRWSVMRELARRSWRHSDRPLALLHGDARIGNVLFAGDTAHWIDHQAVRWGRPAFDVAYFLMFSLRVSDRRAWQPALVRHYRAALVAAGVPDDAYPLSVLEADLRHGVLLATALMAIPFLGAGVSADPETLDRASQGGLVWLARLQSAVDDLDPEWVASASGCSVEAFAASWQSALERPPRLNRGARAVARLRALRGGLAGVE